MDVGARVAAPRSGQRNADDALGCKRLATQVESSERVQAPGAADGERAIARPVEVEEEPPFHERGVEALGSVESRFLRDREQELQRAAIDRRVLDHRQCSRDPDPVVGAERRLGRDHPVAVELDPDPPLARVVGAARLTLAHDVQVRLEDDGRRVFPPWGRRHAHDHVAGIVDCRLEVTLAGPADDPLARPLLLLGRPRDARELGEALPDTGRFEPRERVGGTHLRSTSTAPTKRKTRPATRDHPIAIRSTPNHP